MRFSFRRQSRYSFTESSGFLSCPYQLSFTKYLIVRCLQMHQENIFNSFKRRASKKKPEPNANENACVLCRKNALKWGVEGNRSTHIYCKRIICLSLGNELYHCSSLLISNLGKRPISNVLNQSLIISLSMCSWGGGGREAMKNSQSNDTSISVSHCYFRDL